MDIKCEANKADNLPGSSFTQGPISFKDFQYAVCSVMTVMNKFKNLSSLSQSTYTLLLLILVQDHPIIVHVALKTLGRLNKWLLSILLNNYYVASKTESVKAFEQRVPENWWCTCTSVFHAFTDTIDLCYLLAFEQIMATDKETPSLTTLFSICLTNSNAFTTAIFLKGLFQMKLHLRFLHTPSNLTSSETI